MSLFYACIGGVAGHRARDPPDPIPNSAVKPRSVSGGSAVFGCAKPGKLAIRFSAYWFSEMLTFPYGECPKHCTAMALAPLNSSR